MTHWTPGRVNQRPRPCAGLPLWPLAWFTEWRARQTAAFILCSHVRVSQRISCLQALLPFYLFIAHVATLDAATAVVVNPPVHIACSHTHQECGQQQSPHGRSLSHSSAQVTIAQRPPPYQLRGNLYVEGAKTHVEYARIHGYDCHISSDVSEQACTKVRNLMRARAFLCLSILLQLSNLAFAKQRIASLRFGKCQHPPFSPC